MRKIKDVMAYAKRQHRSNSQAWAGLCQKFVRSAWGLGGGNPSASAQLAECRRNGTFHAWDGSSRVPKGAPVFSDRPGGSRYGHIFLAGGRSKSHRVYWSNDITDYGGIDPVGISAFRTRWGHKIIGWGETVNGTRLDLPLSPHQKRRRKKNRKKKDRRKVERPVDLSVVQAAARHRNKKPWNNVKRLQRCLNYRYGAGIKVTGIYNARTKNWYKRHQKKIGSARRYQDGVPGEKDLRALVRGYSSADPIVKK